jgi:soluble lytic murein transglycosylase-like protein
MQTLKYTIGAAIIGAGLGATIALVQNLNQPQPVLVASTKQAKSSSSASTSSSAASSSVVIAQAKTPAVQQTSYQTPAFTGDAEQFAQDFSARTGADINWTRTIIARESGGNFNAYNPSGASGYMQTMPGWGDTSTYQGQLDAAVNAYVNQGPNAWVTNY